MLIFLAKSPGRTTSFLEDKILEYLFTPTLISPIAPRATPEAIKIGFSAFL